MNRNELQERINNLNEYMLSDTKYQLQLLKISSDYTYNKAVALVEKESKKKDWYSVGNKNCFKTWLEADTFLDGFCLAKNTDFEELHER